MAGNSRVQNPANNGLAGDEARQEVNHAVVDLETLRQNDLSVCLSSGALAIHGASSTLAKVATALRYLGTAGVGGAPVFGLLAAQDLPALVGTVNHGAFGGWVFTVSDDGTGVQTLHSRAITPGATRAAMVFPAVPTNEAVLGFVEIAPSGTGNFVGGTTNLDDGTVVPNAVYVNTVGSPILGGTALAAGLIAAKITLH